MSTVLTQLPTGCAKPGCLTPLSPDVITTPCKHVFHKNCIEHYKQSQTLEQKEAVCPYCNQKEAVEKLFTAQKSTVNPSEDCSICSIKLKPDVVILNCNHGLHSECFHLIYINGSSTDKCPGLYENKHVIDLDERKICTAKEFAHMFTSKAPAPFKYVPPPPKKENADTPASPRTWTSFGWSMTKAALATAVVYKVGRWFF